MNRRAALSGLSPLQAPFSDGDLADLPDLPPVRIPSAVDLLDAATSSPVLQSVTGFATWLGDGRRLDVDGGLTAADARAVAGALGLDGERPSELAALMRWARSAGLVRTVRGRLVPVKSRRALLGRPIDLWRQLFTTFAGDVGSDAEGEGEAPPFVPLWHHWPQMFELLQLSLYTAGGEPVPVEMLLEITLDARVGMLGFAPYANPAPGVREDWHGHLVDALAALESLGAIQTGPSGDPAVDRQILDMSARDDPDLTLAALTPIGLWAVNRMLVEQGVPAPVLGELAGAELSELHRRLAMAGPELVDSELAGWVDHRGPQRAAAEAQTLMQAAEEPAERLFAMRVLALTGEHGVAAAHRLRAAGGIPGSVATGWLLSTEALDPSVAAVEESMLGVVDQFCALADEGFVEVAFEGQSVPDQVRMVVECARTEHPSRLDVLDAIADAPVDRKVAKAARKARLGLRT
jgi:hypothetical protein